MTDHDIRDPALRARAIRAARGVEPFDVLIRGGTVVDAALGRLRAADVGLVGPLVASVHPPGARTDAAETVDATGLFVSPGLIDAHMHVESSMTTPRAYAEVVVPQGTTTVVWDPHEVGNVMGLAGVAWAVAASRGLPLRVLVLAPSCVPSAPGLEVAGAEFDGGEVARLLAMPEVVGVAEVMDMRGVLETGGRMERIVGAGLASGKLVCGHARGLAGADLQAFAAAGIASDHEVTSGEDLVAKLEAGFTVELRGSHDHLLPECVEALNALPAIPQTLTLCTDDVFPDDLVHRGGMNDHLRRLVARGLDPVQALRAATLNAAMRLGRGDLGLVAPGRRADLALWPDLADFRPAMVFADGRLVARDGRLTGELRPDPVPLPAPTMHLPRMTATDFRLDVPRANGPIVLNTVDSARFTRWGRVEAEVRDGEVRLPDGYSLMAVVHRHGRRPARPVVAPIGDWGTFSGCFATTVAHDSHNLVLFGRDPEDMAVAANALTEAGGGMAVVKGGRVLALLALPVCGLVSDRPAAETAAAFAAVRAAADEVAEWKPPYRIFKAFVGASLACNPGPHVTDVGLTDGLTGEIRPLVAV
jgi:adenine deaminase